METSLSTATYSVLMLEHVSQLIIILDRISISVTVKVLWEEYTESHEEVQTTSDSEASLKFYGYNTLLNDAPSFDLGM